jgi:hypothetical protein
LARAHLYADARYIVVRDLGREGSKRPTSSEYRDPMHDTVYGLPRMHLPPTRVNKQGEGPEHDAPAPMVAALHICFSLLNGPHLRRRFQLPASRPTSHPHGLHGVRQTSYQRPLCRPCLAPLLVAVRPHQVQFFSAVLAQYERLPPFPKKPPSPAGVIRASRIEFRPHGV